MEKPDVVPTRKFKSLDLKGFVKFIYEVRKT
jgi:hypothetical protein